MDQNSTERCILDFCVVLFYEKTLLIDNIDSKDIIPNVSLLRRFTNIGLWEKDLNRICPTFHCTGEDIEVPEN